MSQSIRTRFAPSPTGFLHIGGVRTALFNWLLAKQSGGQFVLRLEDTDQERFVKEGVGQVVEAMDWLGLKPDEGFWISEGKHQNVEFVQSERHARGFYKTYAEKLVELGLAYYSPTSKSDLAKMRETAKREKRPFVYRKELDQKNTRKPMDNIPIRFDVGAFFAELPEGNEYFSHIKTRQGRLWHIQWSEAHDRHIQGWTSDSIDDFILIKSDGFPTYNFANVVDDYDMKITHVMRGDEFIASTPKHIILYHALGLSDFMPKFIHLPPINGTDGKKLSKRTGDTNVLNYRDEGYLPEAVLNFLALIGWNDGSEQEIYSLGELKKRFKISQINHSPAVFDKRRLDWISGHHIRSLKLEKLYNLSEFSKHRPRSPKEYKMKVLGLVQERLKHFSELDELTNFFFEDLPLNHSLIDDHKQLKKQSKSDLASWLKQARDSLSESNFSEHDLTKKLNKLLEDTSQKPVVIFSLIRIAVTQAPASPGLAETMAVLGKKRTINRLDQQIKVL